MKLLILAVVEGAAFVALLDGLARWPLWVAILGAVGLVIASWSICLGLFVWYRLFAARRALDRLWPPEVSLRQFQDTRY